MPRRGTNIRKSAASVPATLPWPSISVMRLSYPSGHRPVNFQHLVEQRIILYPFFGLTRQTSCCRACRETIVFALYGHIHDGVLFKDVGNCIFPTILPFSGLKCYLFHRPLRYPEPLLLARLHRNLPAFFFYSYLFRFTPSGPPQHGEKRGPQSSACRCYERYCGPLNFSHLVYYLIMSSVPNAYLSDDMKVLRDRAVPWHCRTAYLPRSPGNMSGLSPLFYLACPLDVRS